MKLNLLERKLLLALLGSSLLLVGAFSPIIKIPVKGDMNYFKIGIGYGIVIILLAVGSAAAALFRKHKWLLMTGSIACSLLLITFIFYQIKKYQLSRKVLVKVASAVVGFVHLQWGWLVLIAGAMLIVAAGAVKEKSTGKAPSSSRPGEA